MGWRQRIAGFFRRKPVNRSYTAAGHGRRAVSWRAPGTGLTSGLTGDLGTLINRSRAALRNDPWASAGISKLVANIVGTGIKPKSEAVDDSFRKELQQLFLDWTDESDADGVLGFYGQQSLAARAMLEAGECFVRLRPRRPEDGLSVPLQVQILEAEFVPWSYNDQEQGYDSEQIDDEIAADNRRADQLDLQYDCDVRIQTQGKDNHEQRE